MEIPSRLSANIEDALQQAMIRRMQQRGIVGQAAGMPEQTDPDQERWDKVLAWAQAQVESQEKAEALKAEAENPPPETATEMIPVRSHRCKLTKALAAERCWHPPCRTGGQAGDYKRW